MLYKFFEDFSRLVDAVENLAVKKSCNTLAQSFLATAETDKESTLNNSFTGPKTKPFEEMNRTELVRACELRHIEVKKGVRDKTLIAQLNTYAATEMIPSGTVETATKDTPNGIGDFFGDSIAPDTTGLEDPIHDDSETPFPAPDTGLENPFSDSEANLTKTVLTLKDVRAKLQVVMEKKGVEEVTKILRLMGRVDTLRDLAEENFEKVVGAANESTR